MSITDHDLETRVDQLTTRVQRLELQLERLAAVTGDLNSPASAVKTPVVAVHKEKDSLIGEPSDVSEEVLTWAGRTSLLPRLATLCFLLVVALILRTITDSGMVSKLIGSGLGMGYAAVLMFLGWYKYSKKSPLAPVFAACGAILMSTIVVETRTHFNALPLVPAYLTLMATGIGMALISRKYNAFTPISVGILGMCFAGAAIDYPHPFFPYLSLVLFTANTLGHFAASLKKCSWLRWSALIVTMIMLPLWGLRLGMAFSRGEAPLPEIAPLWYLPVLAIFCTLYLVLALLGILRAGTDKLSRFDAILPTLSSVWAFNAAHYVVAAWHGNISLLGITGVVIAIVNLSISFWLAKRRVDGARGTNSFAFAGGALLAMALPLATGTYMLSLPVLSIVAIVMAIMSRLWENGGLRVTSYVLQIYCSVALAIMLRGDSAGATDPINMLSAGIMAYILIYHYQWCRRWSPSPSSSFFSQFDNKDVSAAMLLCAGLICAFFMVRVGVYQVVQSIPGIHKDVFRCAQSVIINGAVCVIILFAYIKRNREIRNVAILVTLIGGVKVFVYDLIGGAQGLPLVFSVFSFGLAAAVESVALGKWMKESADKKV